MILFLSLKSEEKTIFQEQNGGIIIIANDQRISAGISAESNTFHCSEMELPS